MKRTPQLPMPWDIAVFLTVASVGLGVSVQSFIERDTSARIRLPNAIESTPGDAASEDLANQTIDLGCLEHHSRNKRFQSEEGALRIRGRFCQISRKGMKRFDGVWVKNLTNGYEGTIIFHGNDTSFVSDYLVLQSGDNRIEIQWRPAPGEAVRTITADVRER